MDKNLTMQDIANHLNLDRTTVSKAISGKGTVSAKTIRRVNQAIEELGYQKDSFASGLVTGKNTVLAVVLPNLGSGFYASFVHSFQREASKYNYGVILYYVGSNRGGLMGIFELIKQQRVSGATFLSNTLRAEHDKDLIKLLNSGMAINTTSRNYVHKAIDGIHYNHRKAGYQLTEHLLQLKHREVVFVGDSRLGGAVYERMLGYREAMQTHGLPPVIIKTAMDDFKPHSDQMKYSYHLLLKEWDTIKHHVSAFIGGNDNVALGILYLMKEKGVSIPDDISLAGFDDAYADMAMPPLTSMRFPQVEAGKKAVELLMSRIKGENFPSERLLLDYEIIKRESTAEYVPKQINSNNKSVKILR